MIDYETAYSNAEGLLEALRKVMAVIDSCSFQDECVEGVNCKFSDIVKRYFKNLTLETFLTSTFRDEWFDEFEDECYFNMDSIDSMNVFHAYNKVGTLVAAYWL